MISLVPVKLKIRYIWSAGVSRTIFAGTDFKMRPIYFKKGGEIRF